MVRKGVRSRLGRLWGISRTYIFFSFGVCTVMIVLGGLQFQNLGCCDLASYQVDNTDILRGRSDYCLDACVA